MSLFFINRPVFACVLALIVMLVGGLLMPRLPVAQYPDVAMPQIAISAMYPGATAKAVDQRVTQIIEQQMKGLDNLLYMSSASDSHGNAEMYFTFAAGTNSDTAQVQVQNRLQQAMPMLPEQVQRQGVQVGKSVENSFMTVAFHAAQGKMSASDLSDYVDSHLVDALNRVDGVGSTTLYGGRNAMRIWCDPERMQRYSLNPQDVIAAIQEQNIQLTAGQVGAAPSPAGQQTHFSIEASCMMSSVADFEQIPLRMEADGSVLRLREVARVELNEESFMGKSRFNGRDAVGLAFKLASGANVLETSRAIRAELAKLARFFPDGLVYDFVEDRAPIVGQSVNSALRTLAEAIALVVVVMLVFLQNWRATVIPAIALPIVILGIIAVLAFLSFSINTLTLFGMVLSIGLLVDDAIIVVENVERLMREEGMPPRDAAIASMRQVSGALVAVAAVISAVFAPMSLMEGSLGIIYRQFSVTIVAAMLLSALVALVLSPALCATIMPPLATGHPAGLLCRCRQALESFAAYHAAKLQGMLTAPQWWLSGFACMVCLCVPMYWQLPTAFMPDEDQGMLMVDVQLPPSATFERTAKVLERIDAHFRQTEQDAVANVMTVEGWSLAGSGQACGLVMIQLKDWSERSGKDSVFNVAERARKRFSSMPEAEIFVLLPPAIMELGASNGFELQLMDMVGSGHEALFSVKDAFLQQLSKCEVLADTRHSGLENAEQYRLVIDNGMLGMLKLGRHEVNKAIAAYWGGEYVNDFSDRGRTKKVCVQADPLFRTSVDDFGRYHVRNSSGEMVPFSSFLKAESHTGPQRLTRHQGVPSVKIEGSAAPGQSSGQAMQALEQLAHTLPRGYDMAWTGLSYQEKTASSQAINLFAISIVCAFLCLAALYESWIIPFAILLVVPVGVFGCLAAAWLFGLHDDVHFQIAMLGIAGLSAKNSILVVSFARDLQKQGKDLVEATCIASRQRLRPILMTSSCFILGVAPLLFANGAGSAAQHALGIAVIAGMLSTTILGIFYTPMFFVLVSRLCKKEAPAHLAGKGA